MEVDEAEFFNRLLDYRNILYLCHRNADPDAVSSAFALSEAIGGTVGLVDGCNRVAAVLIDRLDIEVVDKPNPADYGFVVVVDTSTKAQLNDLELTRYCVIDHHTTTALTENSEFFLHRNSTSTVEIVYNILKAMGAPINRRVGIGMLTGIVTDTGHFKHASADTFRTVSRIIEDSGIEYGEVLDLMAATPQDISMRIAILKAASRIELDRVQDMLIASSHVSSFGGSASSMLINIGADVAFVGTSKGESVRISARAKRDVVSAGVNLGQLMEDIGNEYNGTGGGHSGAAGIDVIGDMKEVLDKCRERTKKILETSLGGTSKEISFEDDIEEFENE
ncbi:MULTISPECIES: DHH family phosphoesterase [Methanosarcina]|uniref:Exopolyphosphatase-related protein n=2 Tax=Methanosarcina barkeri TaxID=2208 RepID=A0A0E3QW89_METBA|nr:MULTISPECIES: bifunctional oligoribonuclease/PAP phosphatase NrnA [Methanosarcina]AKB55745.1 Exopolyphosphatase-related protein [Methanosarcina barkeri MS]AKB59221.1 Exopolyphosphatase-related protein [Methanosarcina barkeri 227]OEC89302.1 phosphotransferase [Methanosarcina sp. A14]